jgi:hypothetical protein
MAHAITWQTAQPLWQLSLQDGGSSPPRFRSPALLRFLGDDYMRQLQTTLQVDPTSLSGYVARPETWDQEQVGWRNASDPPEDSPLRLYQPAHYRHYLVAAALICQLPGLPERQVKAADRESCSFVMRRLFAKAGATLDESDSSTYDEYAWVGTAQRGEWQPVPSDEVVLPQEERLALFPKAFAFESVARTVLAGLIPVARREVYQAGAAVAAKPVSAATLRADTFSSAAAAAAFQQIDKALDELSTDNDAQPTQNANEPALLEQKKLSLANVLLDIALFLQSEVSAVFGALAPGSTTAGLNTAQQSLLSEIDRKAPGAPRTYREILLAVSQETPRTAIENGTLSGSTTDSVLGISFTTRAQLGTLATDLKDGTNLRTKLVDATEPRAKSFAQDVLGPWATLSPARPSMDSAQDDFMKVLLALADFLQTELPDVWSAFGGNTSGLNTAQRTVFNLLAQTAVARADWRTYITDADANRPDIVSGHITPAIRVVADKLTAAEIAATVPFSVTLQNAVSAALATIALPSQSSAHNQVVASPPPPPDGPAWYRIRCVYERPKCAPVHDPVVSDPCAPFQLAPFFDPGAPIRPIRIQMPEASLDQLRRGAKGVAIATSKDLRAQVDRARSAGLKGLVDQDVGGGQSFDFGLVCQLSIPIITICAFILLMIIVQLLNIVFFWIPYFILCLPRIGKQG